MPDFPQTLFTSIQKYPDIIAFNIDGTSYTYHELENHIASFQSLLLSNIASNAIGIIANQDFDTYSIILAALLSGITYVPIEPTHPDERNNQIVRISKVRDIFCSDFSSLSTEFTESNKLKFFQAENGLKDSAELKVIQTDNPAYILFTSGSTGVPKGVPISIQNLNAFVINVDGMMLGISKESRFLQVFELTFDLSVFSYLVPLLYGASVYLLPKTPFKQMAAIQLIEEQSITHILSVPSFVGYIKPFFSKIRLTTVQNWLFCGEALKADLVVKWQKCIPHATIYNVYGPTEATIFCTSYKCGVNEFKDYLGIVCIGKPFKDIEFGLFEGQVIVNATEMNAELCISGSQLTTGYLDYPEKNKTAFFPFNENMYYRSGDLCRIDNEGDYFFSSRNDTQVKINGYRIEISELEYHAGDYPAIEEAVIIVTNNDKNDQQVLNLVYTAKTEISKDDIISFLSKKIPSYMLPTHIFFVQNIPYNLNGKTDKKALADLITKIN